MHHCELLGIEDIIAFFPDFVLIDDFKERMRVCVGEGGGGCCLCMFSLTISIYSAICAALDNYKIKIDDLRAEMDDAMNSAEAMRVDIRKLKRRYHRWDIGHRPSYLQSPLLFPFTRTRDACQIRPALIVRQVQSMFGATLCASLLRLPLPSPIPH